MEEKLEFIDCKDCIYFYCCPVMWHNSNSACLKIQKRKKEIIHCGECKFYNSWFVECDHETNGEHDGMKYLQPTSFCSKAEKKEE